MLLRDFCLLKNKEHFLQLITSHGEPYASFDDSVYGDDFYYFIPSEYVA